MFEKKKYVTLKVGHVLKYVVKGSEHSDNDNTINGGNSDDNDNNKDGGQIEGRQKATMISYDLLTQLPLTKLICNKISNDISNSNYINVPNH